MLFKKTIFLSKGMSLIEVMVVVTIMGIVGVGTATLMKNMVAVQERTDLKAAAAQIKARMEQYIKDDAAFGHSVESNNELACLRPDTPPCAHNPNALPDDDAANWVAGATFPTFPIYDPQGNMFFNGWSGFPNGGISPLGTYCATFSPTLGAGDDDCPFRYELYVWYKCTNGRPSCTRPKVIVRGELLFNPRNSVAVNARINVDDYRIHVERGRSVRFDTLQIVHEDPDPVFDSPPVSKGGGNCDPLIVDGVFRPFTNERYDSGDNVELINPVAGRGYRNFTLQPGTYECKITTQSYQPIDGFSVVLLDIDNNIRYPAGGGFAGPGSTAHSTESVQLVLTTPTSFELRHICTTSYSTPAEQWDLGIPLFSYSLTTPTVYTAVTCTRSS